MKRALFYFAVVMIIAVSCKKKESPPPPPPAPAPDKTPPAISLKGRSEDTVSLNASYVDPGATATDNVDGDISSKITVTGSVDKDRVSGNYLYYNVKDAAGNSAQATRYVYVRNDAYRLAGTYNVISSCGANFNGLTSVSEVTTSTMHNNRIIISNQQFQTSGFNVTADVNGTSISMAIQPVASSLASGTGTLSADLRSFTLTTTYTPAIQGSGGCTIIYTRQ
jgi:hypothetical protein